MARKSLINISFLTLDAVHPCIKMSLGGVAGPSISHRSSAGASYINVKPSSIGRKQKNVVNQPDTTECPVQVYARRRAHKFRVVLASAEQSRADLESSDELVLIAGYCLCCTNHKRG